MPWTEIPRKKQRVLPASQILISTIDGTRSPCPLIRDFLRSLGKSDNGKEQKLPEEPIAEENSISEEVEVSRDQIQGRSIDDSAHSSLSTGQHRRFLQLSERKSERELIPQVRYEFKKLRSLVESEQSLYLEALLFFWQAQDERLSIGFRGGEVSSFVQHAAQCRTNMKMWKGMGLPARFGKHCQIITVPLNTTGGINVLDSVQRHPIFFSTTEANACEHNPQLLPEGSQIPFFSTTEANACEHKPNLLPEGSQIPSPSKESASDDSVLNDPEALRIAKQHEVDVVIGESTLALLIRVDEVGSWLIPTSRPSDAPNVLVVGDPIITTFASPRECLTKGYRDALFEDFRNRTRTCHHNNNDSPNISTSLGSEYVIWTLPPVRQKKHKILVRRENRLIQQESGPCVRLHVHLEYFPERGHEISSNADMALCMLEFLLEPFSRVALAKVNPNTSTIIGWEDVSLAQTLTRSASATRMLSDGDQSCSKRWHTLLDLLGALPMIGQKQHVLCFPVELGGRRSVPSISVHLLDDGETEFHVSDFLSGASVPLDSSALRRCYRPWTWRHERTPYTFPTKES